MTAFKSGFVSIIGKPNAGKSTLLNAFIGDKLAIVSPKVQTTRHRIFGILTEKDYQVIFSDTPGLLMPNYKMQEKMLEEIKSVRKDTDVLIYLADARADIEEEIRELKAYDSQKPTLFVLNKAELESREHLMQKIEQVDEALIAEEVICISALEKEGLDFLLNQIIQFLPEHPPYFREDEISDRPVRFFVQEMIREKIFHHCKEEIPYHTTVLIRAFKEKKTLTKIIADIIVSRETQKGIIIGKAGQMLRRIGEESRKEIEEFLGNKVFLELFVKVRKDWRNNDTYLKEYGY